jgi:hypothetical protein
LFLLSESFRILPHDQDTGGFFVAVLEKSATPEGAESENPEGEKKNNRPNQKNQKNINTAKDALVPLTEKSLPFWHTTKYVSTKASDNALAQQKKSELFLEPFTDVFVELFTEFLRNFRLITLCATLKKIDQTKFPSCPR